MKRNVKIIVLSIMMLLCTTVSFAFTGGFDVPTMHKSPANIGYSVNFISRGVAMILQVLQFLEFIVPIALFITMLILNKGKNTVKNVIMHLIISIVIGFAISGVGFIIIDKSSDYGYSSMSASYINYNGHIVYYHK